MKILIVPYDSNWPTLFEKEQKLLSEIFSNVPHHIEHIGSTAVEGLSAKPIIDIMIGMEDFSLANDFIENISQHNYIYISEYEKEMPFRRYFFKEQNGEHTHHLHLVEFENEFWKRHLLFRDHLRKNLIDRNAYEELKKELAKREWGNGNDYANAKTEFIRNMETKIIRNL